MITTYKYNMRIKDRTLVDKNCKTSVVPLGRDKFLILKQNSYSQSLISLATKLHTRNKEEMTISIAPPKAKSIHSMYISVRILAGSVL